MQYVSFSGGCDSTALAIYLKDKGEEFELVFADTGAELPETYWIIPRVVRALGVKLNVVSGPTFFQQVAAFGYLLPSMQVRWCTRELKLKPLEAFPDLLLGICADEAHRMPNKPRPLVDAGITKAEARKLVEAADLLNPCYKWRSSCSCFCCPFQRVRDWRGLWTNHPDLYRAAEQWEEESCANSPSKHTWMRGYGLRDLREADQVDMFPECKERACVICEA